MNVSKGIIKLTQCFPPHNAKLIHNMHIICTGHHTMHLMHGETPDLGSQHSHMHAIILQL